MAHADKLTPENVATINARPARVARKTKTAKAQKSAKPMRAKR